MSPTKAVAGSASSSALCSTSAPPVCQAARARSATDAASPTGDIREDGGARALRESQSLLLDAPHRGVQGFDYGFVVVRGKTEVEDALILWTQVRRERRLKRLPSIRPTGPCLEQRAILAVAEEVGLQNGPLSACHRIAEKQSQTKLLAAVARCLLTPQRRHLLLALRGWRARTCPLAQIEP